METGPFDRDGVLAGTMKNQAKTINKTMKNSLYKLPFGYTSIPKTRQAIQMSRQHPENQTSYPTVQTTSWKLDKLSKGLDNIPEVAGKKMRRAGGPPNMC